MILQMTLGLRGQQMARFSRSQIRNGAATSRRVGTTVAVLVTTVGGTPSTIAATPRAVAIQGWERRQHKLVAIAAEGSPQKAGGPPSASEMWLSFGFAPPDGASAEPSLKKRGFLFKYSTADVKKQNLNYHHAELKAFSTLEEASRETAGHVDMKGSCSVAAGTTASDHTHVAKMRADHVGISKKYDVRVITDHHHHFLDSGARQNLLQQTPKQIVETYGEFYPKSMVLGGLMRSTFTKRSRRMTMHGLSKAKCKQNTELLWRR